MLIIPKIDPEFKALIPPLSTEERAQLEENILSKGKCRDALILWEGIIIDGHNRFEICAKHGIEFEIAEIPLSSREEAKLWLLENQLGRRNLTDAARIELALSKAELLREKAKINKSRSGGNKQGLEPVFPKKTKRPEDSIYVNEAIITEAGVSNGTFYNYLKIKETANPKLLTRIQSGEVKINTIHRVLGKELTKQLTRADKMYRYIANNLPDDTESRQIISTNLNDLEHHLQSLLTKLEGIHT